MPERDTLVKWLKWLSFAIGLAIAAIGGGGTAVQYQLDPGAYGDSAVVAETVTTYTLSGIFVSVIGPGLVWLVNFLWGKVSKGKAQPYVRYTAAIGAKTTLAKYLEGVPTALPLLNDLSAECRKKFEADVEAAAVVVESK